MEHAAIFNPLDKRNLGKSVVEALLKSKELALGSVKPFAGAGVYAIYYKGGFKAYAPLAALNKKSGSFPIYVGKAVPKGGRKGVAEDAALKSSALFSRLNEHRISIEAVASLKIADFTYRCLIVDDIWIPLGESLVIQKFQPLWNHVVEGFGNHDPGGGRYQGMRPLWDELHPGRGWAAKCQPPKAQLPAIQSMIESYMQAVIKKAAESAS
jgi:hypothetical protein